MGNPGWKITLTQGFVSFYFFLATPSDAWPHPVLSSVLLSPFFSQKLRAADITLWGSATERGAQVFLSEHLAIKLNFLCQP